jgi:hypothetical protein
MAPEQPTRNPRSASCLAHAVLTPAAGSSCNLIARHPHPPQELNRSTVA